MLKPNNHSFFSIASCSIGLHPMVYPKLCYILLSVHQYVYHVSRTDHCFCMCTVCVFQSAYIWVCFRVCMHEYPREGEEKKFFSIKKLPQNEQDFDRRSDERRISNIKVRDKGSQSDISGYLPHIQKIQKLMNENQLG